ncbi:MAG: type VI secretion system contractile sheath protein TssC [Ferruginibacter sp.]
MAQEQANAAEESKFNEQVAAKSAENPGELLDTSIKQLEDFGGFDLFEDLIDGVQNMNPIRKARKKIFVDEAAKKTERETLKKNLKVWLEALTSATEIADIVKNCDEKSASAQTILIKNLKAAVERTQQLETSYRSVGAFFANTESTKVKNVSFMNTDPEKVRDTENPRFIKAIEEELTANYDRLDMKNNYSLLILPGYLGSNSLVEKWAKIAFKNKVLLVTDFDNVETPDLTMDDFENAKLTGGEVHRSNVIMTCNWLVGRGKFNELDEEDDLYVPPSPALAGKIFSTLMSQPTAGKKHGGMNEIDGVRYELKKSEIANLEKLGLVPMVKEYGKVMAFSAKTLFNGDNLGLQTYSVVRVFDYVSKVIMDFLNRRTFENFDAVTRKDLNSQIVKFLDGITGPGKLIEEFTIKRFDQDPIQKDKIYLDIHMKPYFPAKTFMIKLAGQKGDNASDWESEYEQEKK